MLRDNRKSRTASFGKPASTYNRKETGPVNNIEKSAALFADPAYGITLKTIRDTFSGELSF